MTDRLIRLTTALAVAAVAAVAAVISYRHAYELVTTHGETGVTARLVPFTLDGLILAASLLLLDASRRNHPAPPLARWCLGAGIVATIGANLAHGLGDGPLGALVSAWPALALSGSFELLMTLVRTGHRASAAPFSSTSTNQPMSVVEQDASRVWTQAPSLEQTVRAWHAAGHSQRAIARELNIDRRKVRRIVAQERLGGWRHVAGTRRAAAPARCGGLHGVTRRGAFSCIACFIRFILFPPQYALSANLRS